MTGKEDGYIKSYSLVSRNEEGKLVIDSLYAKRLADEKGSAKSETALPVTSL